MNRPVICLIVDNLRLRRWESEALLQLAETADFLLLNCTITRFTRRPVPHAFYYVLNIMSLKMPASRSVPLPETLKIVDRLDFESEWEGPWQRFTQERARANVQMATARRDQVENGPPPGAGRAGVQDSLLPPRRSPTVPRTSRRLL